MYLSPPIELHLKKLSSIGDPFQYFMQLKGECFRQQEGRLTQRVVLEGQPYFIKQHRGLGWREILKNFLQGKFPILGAQNEWRAIQRLQELAIPTPKLAAFGARGINPAQQESFVLMEELHPTISLEDYCRSWKTQPPAFSEKLSLIHKVAHIAQTLHRHGLNHRDFYLCHFLLHKSSQDLYLIDLHRAGIHRHLRTRWIIKDLAGLYFSSMDLGLSQKDLLRFIRLYVGGSLRDTLQNEKNFWSRVKQRGEKLYASGA